MWSVLFFHSHSQNVRNVCMRILYICVSCNSICSPSEAEHEKVDRVSKTLHIRSLSTYSSIADSDLKTWHHLTSNYFCLPCRVALFSESFRAYSLSGVPLSINKTLGLSFGTSNTSLNLDIDSALFEQFPALKGTHQIIRSPVHATNTENIIKDNPETLFW